MAIKDTDSNNRRLNMESSNLILYNLTPDLLDRDALIQILNDRCIELPNMNTMSKDELVALFHRVVAPLPQRTRCTGQPQHMPLQQDGHGYSNGFSFAIKSSSFQSKNRLKPPPNVSSAHKKVRLTATQPQCSSYLDKIIIHDRRKRSMQNEAEKSEDKTIACTVNEINVLDKIVINNRTSNEKLVPKDAQTYAVNTMEQISKSSRSVMHDEGGNVGQSVSLKPRIKLKRPSLNSSGMESSSHNVEPEIKKPKTKIVF